MFDVCHPPLLAQAPKGHLQNRFLADRLPQQGRYMCPDMQMPFCHCFEYLSTYEDTQYIHYRYVRRTYTILYLFTRIRLWIEGLYINIYYIWNTSYIIYHKSVVDDMYTHYNLSIDNLSIDNLYCSIYTYTITVYTITSHAFQERQGTWQTCWCHLHFTLNRWWFENWLFQGALRNWRCPNH